MTDRGMLEVGNVDRLVRTGASDYAATLNAAEKKLGAALWTVIDLERGAPGNHPDGGGGLLDDFNELRTREAQIGPRTSAELAFRALRMFEDLEKSNWLLRVYEATLIINSFSRDLPHTDDQIAQSRLIIRPKNPISAYGQQEINRDAPYILETDTSESMPLPAYDVETATLILGKLAAEYP